MTCESFQISYISTILESVYISYISTLEISTYIGERYVPAITEFLKYVALNKEIEVTILYYIITVVLSNFVKCGVLGQHFC